MDIGNTRSKYVSVVEGQRSTISYCQNDQLTQSWLTEKFAKATEFILANVNNDNFSALIKSWSQDNDVKYQLLKTRHQQFELTCAYAQPSQLGIDRWLAMLGASLLFPNKACLVIDAGTATTIDAISDENQHLGGWILPGIEMLYSSLVNNTQKISVSKIDQASIALGKNTSECVNNGTWAITVGAIELQYKKMQKQYAEVEIILTGGNRHEIASQLNDEHHIIDDLIFIGMQRFCS